MTNMKRRVKIVAMPKAQSGLETKLTAGLGFNANQLNWPIQAGEFSAPNVSVKKVLEPTDWDNANLEAEKGETVVTDLNRDGIPQHFKIGGKRHSEGGTPLNLPPDSFIFSRDKSMKIKNEDILKMFGKKEKRGGFTPADIAKQYDINEYRKVLADPDSDDLQRETAEMMIANYNLKLGKLALAQESLKGFPQGIPQIAMPYLENMGMNPEDFVQTQGEKDNSSEGDMARYGKEVLPKAQLGRHRVRIIPPAGGFMYPMNPGYGYGYPVEQPQVNVTQSTTVTKKQEIPKDALVIKRSDYKTEEEYIAARDKAYKESQGKPVYTQGSDGKYYSVGTKQSPIDEQKHVQLIQDRFSDPAVQQALYDRTMAAVKDKKNRGRDMGFSEKELEELGPQGLANQFIEMQTRNVKTGYLMANEGISYDCFDNTTGKRLDKCKDKVPYTSLDDMFAKTGVGGPKDKKSVGFQQAAYIGYRDLLKDRDAGKIEDENLKATLKPFNISFQGVKDEEGVDVGKQISKIDTYYTNTTTGQMAGIDLNEIGENLVPETEEEQKKQQAIKHMGPEYVEEKNAPWWLQDIIRTAGAFGDAMRVKKYMPWQATPAVYLPDAVLADPNRELAANAEQANIMAQNLAAFSGPKALSSRSSQIQGQAAKNAADILSRYANMNVGTVNNVEMAKANIMNQAAQNRAGLATQLYDKNVIANQQFDNAKNLARQNLRQAYIDAITNKEMTYNLNQLFPQYAVHPEWGGGIEFTKGRPITPTDPSSQEAALNKYKTYRHQLPGVDDNTIWNLVKSDMGQGTAGEGNADMNYLKMLMASQGQM